MNTPDTPLERVRAFLAPCSRETAHPEVKLPDVALRNLAPQSAIQTDDLRVVLGHADTALGLAAFAANVAAVFKLPSDFDLGDLLTTIKRSRDDHLEQSELLRGISKALGLSVCAKASSIAEAVDTLKGTLKEQRRECAQAREYADLIRKALAAGDDVALPAAAMALAQRAKDSEDRAVEWSSRAGRYQRYLGEVAKALNAPEGQGIGTLAESVGNVVRRANESDARLINYATSVDELREQLRVETEKRKQAQAELADFKGHCSRIEAENQRYRGSTLDAKATHERRIGPGRLAPGVEQVTYTAGGPLRPALGHDGRIVLEDGAQADSLAGFPLLPEEPANTGPAAEAELGALLAQAPIWAWYVAVDADGEAWAYEKEPVQWARGRWGRRNDSERVAEIGHLGRPITNWQLTLRCTPQRFQRAGLLSGGVMLAKGL